jgi:hypothetical protein
MGRYDGAMQKFWSIPAVGLYFYVATVLTDWGFLSYFNIPSSFVQASLSGNIIFFYQFIHSTLELLGSFHWYVYVAAGFFFVVLVALYYLIFQYNRRLKNTLVAIGTLILFLYLGTFFRLGNLIASTQTSFVVPVDCSVGSAYAYVVPMTDENETVLVPIDQNNKMTGGYLVKTTSDSSCTFEWKNVGKVVQ